MGIKNRATQSQIDGMFAVRLERIETAIISRLIFIGETFVNNARANGTYNDITGNLRGSICYVVLKNGSKKSPGDVPSSSSKRMKELIAQFNKGYVLIVLAGMDYAAAVESKGKDVLTASSTIAKVQLKQAVTNFKNSLKSA
jgi:hypothetical protein